jgi:hypothetical protein
MLIEIEDKRYTFRWLLNQQGLFTIRSMYLALAADNVLPRMHIIWRLKLPLQIKIFASSKWLAF